MGIPFIEPHPQPVVLQPLRHVAHDRLVLSLRLRKPSYGNSPGMVLGSGRTRWLHPADARSKAGLEKAHGSSRDEDGVIEVTGGVGNERADILDLKSGKSARISSCARHL